MPESTWLVVPCYNESLRLDASEFLQCASSSDAPTILFVDDGSTDSTLNVLDSLAAAAAESGAARLRVLTMAENVGKAEAVRAGLRAAVAAGACRTGYWDADLATPLEMIGDFERTLDDRPDIDVVMGARVRLLGREIQRSGLRHLAGRVFGTVASVGLRLPVYDTQCGAKLLRVSPALEAALRKPFRSGWAFDVELLARLQAAWGEDGATRIVEIPLLRWRDVRGSKVSVWSAAGAFLYLLRLSLRNSVRPSSPALNHASADLPAEMIAGRDER